MEFNVIKNLFNCIKENNCLKLNAEILLKYDIDNKSISTLLNKNILQRRIKGEYGVNLEYLYLYIKKMSRTEYIDQALQFFLNLKETMQLTSKSKHYLAIVNYESICYQIFKLYILKEDFFQSYEYLKQCSKRKSFFNQTCFILLDYLLGNKNEAKDSANTEMALIKRLAEIKKDCDEHNFELALKKIEQIELDSNLMDLKLSDSKINVLKKLLARSIEKQNRLFDPTLNDLENDECHNIEKDLRENLSDFLVPDSFGDILSRKKNS